MKKVILSMCTVLALSCGFVSCGDDDDDESISYATSAEQASAATYTGTWTLIADDGTESTYSGTVTLAASNTKGVTNVTFSCPESSLNATSVANVWNSRHEFQFVNQTDNNGLGAAFAGRITEDGQLTTSFTISQKVGRKTMKVVYSFIGKK